MNRKKYWIVIIAFVTSLALVGCKRKPDRTIGTELRFKGASGIELRFKIASKQIDLLKSLRSAYVVFGDLPPAAEKYGLTEQALRTEVGQMFRQHGVKILSDEDYERALVSGKGVSYIKVHPTSIYEENGTVIVELYF